MHCSPCNSFSMVIWHVSYILFHVASKLGHGNCIHIIIFNINNLVFPATPTLQHDFTIQLGSSTITPSASVRYLGVIFDDQLTFKEHIAKTARSCRFALHNIRKIRPFLTEHAAQLLVQALVISRLDYCSALLAGLPSNTNLYKWFRMQRHDWSSTSPKEHMLHLSLSPCTGYQLQLASSSRHWCLHIEQPQGQHPPTSTHYHESTSLPEAPPTSTHYYESTSLPEAPPTSTNYYESTSPPEAPPTSTHYYESTSPPEAPPTSTHYYESTSPPEAPPTSTHYHESTSPPEAPPTSTHYHESTSPPEAPPTSTHYYESTSLPEAPPTSTHYHESTSPPEAPPTSTHYYESTSLPEAPPTSTHYYESTSPPEVPPTSTHYYESTAPPEAPPTSTHYYESTAPPEAPPTSTHYYESTSPPEAPPTSTHYYESTAPPEAPPTSTHSYKSTSPPEAPPTSTHYNSTSPPEAPPTSTHYYKSTSPPEAPPTSTHYYESTSPPEAPPTSTHYYEFTSPPEVWDLRVSDASWYHHREAQNHSPEHSRSPFLAAGMIFPPPSGALDPCQSSSINWKLISFNTTWLHKNKKNPSPFLYLHIYLSLLAVLACIYLNNAWDLVLLALPLYVCLFKINRFMYSPIISRFG